MDLRFKWTERFGGEWDRVMDIAEVHQQGIITNIILGLVVLIVGILAVLWIEDKGKRKQTMVRIIAMTSGLLLFLGAFSAFTLLYLIESHRAIGKGYYQSDVVTVNKIEQSGKTVTGDYTETVYVLGDDDFKWSADHELKGIKEGDKVRMMTKKEEYVTKDTSFTINALNTDNIVLKKVE